MYLSKFRGSINKGKRGEAGNWQSLHCMLIKSIVSKWSFGHRLEQVTNDLMTLGYAYIHYSFLSMCMCIVCMIYLDIQNVWDDMIITWFYSRLWSSASANSKFHSRRSPLALIFGRKACKTPRICLACSLTLKKISNSKIYVVSNVFFEKWFNRWHVFST